MVIIFMIYSLFLIGKQINAMNYSRALLWIGFGVLIFTFVAFPWKGLNPKHDYASSYDNIGILFYLTGDHQKALRYYKMAIAYDPAYVKSYNNIGGLYYSMGEKTEALKYWKKGLERDPDAPLIHFNLANMYTKNGHLEKAKKAYAIAASGMPYSIKIKELQQEFGFINQSD